MDTYVEVLPPYALPKSAILSIFRPRVGVALFSEFRHLNMASNLHLGAVRHVLRLEHSYTLENHAGLGTRGGIDPTSGHCSSQEVETYPEKGQELLTVVSDT